MSSLHRTGARGLATSLSLMVTVALVGCGEGGGSRGPSGAAGTTGAAGTGSATAGTGGGAGTTGAAGTGSATAGTGGGAGTGAAGAAGQAGGAAGAVADAGTDAGAAGTGGGAVDAGGDVVVGRAWSCPAGPFEAPKAGQAQAVCPGFNLKYGWSEGPTWIASEKAFFFSNFVINASGPGDMIKYAPETGKCEFFIEGNGCNGLGVGANGKIVATCHTPRAVLEYDPTTKQSRVLADMAEGKLLDSPNDLIVHRNGTIYFSNPTYELGGRPQGLGNALAMISPAGAVTVLRKGGLNGVALSPDDKRLYVVGMGVFDLDDAGLPKGNPQGFSLGGDGIAVDCAGNVYENGGTIRNPAGQSIGNFPGGTNMAFGGLDGKTLLVVANKSIRTVQMNVPGIP